MGQVMRSCWEIVRQPEAHDEVEAAREWGNYYMNQEEEDEGVHGLVGKMVHWLALQIRYCPVL